MHALLRHLEAAGFAAAPRLVGSGLDTDGREMLTFIEGEFTQPGPWSLDGAAAVGRMLRVAPSDEGVLGVSRPLAVTQGLVSRPCW